MEKKRLVYLDIIKIIAIIAMMIIHVAASQIHNVPSGSVTWNVFAFYQCITHFCVPIFFMCSGVFFLNSKRAINIERLYKHNILRLVTALLFWGTLYAIHLFISYSIKTGWGIHECISKVYNDEFVYGHYHLWFLYVMIGIYIVVPILRVIATNKKIIEYYLIIAFIFGFVRNINTSIPCIGYKIETIAERMEVSLVVGYSAYFLLGYYLHEYQLKKGQKKILYCLGFLSVIGMVIWTLVLFPHNVQKNEFMYKYLIPTQLFYSASLFVFAMDKLKEIKVDDNTEKKITSLSEMTFGMYLVHDFFIIALEEVGITTLLFIPFISVPLLTILVFVLSFGLVWCINKIPILNKYIT